MPAKPQRLKIEAERLKAGAMTYELQEPPVALDLLEDPEYVFDDPITGTLEARIVGDTVLLRGTIKTFATSPCGRCLETIRIPLIAHVTLTYMTDERLKDPDRFPDFADDSSYWYDGEIIFPGEQLRENLLLELPSVPACELEPGDICPIRGVRMTPPVFGPSDDEVAAKDEEDENSLKAQLKRMKKTKGE
ncbi:hypothetical protein BH09SUM1_BH09SUM1_32750 [soil metagenome]